MPVEFRKVITRKMLQDEPNTLFIFGDNLMRRGLGGQAKEMRGEPNAIGLPTKHAPSMDEDSFFTEDDIKFLMEPVAVIISKLVSHLENGGTVVWPQDGVGTGRAELKKRAPNIYCLYENVLKTLLVMSGDQLNVSKH